MVTGVEVNEVTKNGAETEVQPLVPSIVTLYIPGLATDIL